MASTSTKRLDWSKSMNDFPDFPHALHAAIERDQIDVVDDLLKDWMLRPLSVIDTRSLYTSSPTLSANSPPFESSEYFKILCEAPPTNFRALGNTYKHIWYFLRRMMDRWRLKECLFEDLGDEPQVKNEPQFKDDPTSELQSRIPQRILEDVLQAIEQDQEFFTARLRAQDVDYLDALWEIYGHEPTLFHFMADWAASIDAYYFCNRQSLESHYEDRSNVKFQAMLNVWSRSHHQKLAHTASFLNKLQQDWNFMRDCWWRSYGLNDTSPFWRGLTVVCDQLLSYVAEKEVNTAVEMMSQPSWQSQASLPDDEPPDCAVSKDDADERGLKGKAITCHYLLASAGSGKTQRLMDMLSKSYGFYLTSGAIGDDPMVVGVGETLYQPQTAGSRDTELLFQTTQFPWLRMNGASIASAWLRTRCSSLILWRLELLYRIAERSRNRSLHFNFSPQTWLQYQLSCQSEQDSFRRLFRLSIIAGSQPPNPVMKRGFTFQDDSFDLENFLEQDELLWCFDEVQCDLSELTEQPKSGFRGHITILEGLIHALRSFGILYRYPNLGTVSFLSGTALNIDKVRAVLRKLDETYKPTKLEGHKSAVLEVFAPTFSLVTSEEEFTKVFNRRITGLLDVLHGSSSPEDFVRKTYSRGTVFVPSNERICSSSRLFEHFRSYCTHPDSGVPPSTTITIRMIEESKPQILQNSLPFRGRYRWSVYYAEKLLERFFKDGELTDQAIDEVTEEAKCTLKAPIRRRLRDLAKMPEKTSMLKDVFNMAFDADLLGRSRILYSNSSSELIEQALGYVESTESEGVEAVKVSIAERLVVESVMEYLDETQQQETLVNEYLYANQFHEGALGDAAEFGLAASVNRLSSQTLAQRKDLISAFDTVHRISATGCVFNQKLNLANFFLEKGHGLPRDYMSADGKDLDLDKWLQLVREKAPRPTFLFPEQVAGPDLMFVYKERAGMRRIVFAIQLKTGHVNASSDAVLNTMDPDRWFSSSPELKQRLQYELQACNNTSSISFFSVLFVAAMEMSATTKYDVAIDYMENRISISSRWKSGFQKVLKHLRSAECRYRNQRTPATEAKLRTAEQALTMEIDAFRIEQSRMPAADLAKSTNSAKRVPKQSHSVWSGRLSWSLVGGLFINFLTALTSEFWRRWFNSPKKSLREPEESISTDYYFQILADDAVEKVFGCVFARLIRGVKSKKPFNVQRREQLPTSSGSSASGDAQNDGNESGNTADDDGDDMFGDLYD